MMNENNFKKIVRINFTKLAKGILFNNNVGLGWVGKQLKQVAGNQFLIEGRKTEIGFGRGTSDLIGIRQVKITPDMVGETIGQFIAIETKKTGWKYRGTPHEKEQLNFLEQIKKHGGHADFISTPEELENFLSKKIK